MSEIVHVIKNGEQASDVRQNDLPIFETSQHGGSPAGRRVQRRVPASAATPASEGEAPEAQAAQPSLRGRVVRREEARVLARPVTVAPGDPAPDAARPSTAEEEGRPPEDEEASAEETALSEKEQEEEARSAAEWREHLAEATAAARSEGRAAGHQAGYEEGYEAAEAAAQAEADEQRATLLEDVARLDDRWAHYLEEQAPMLVALALDLAETLLDTPLATPARQVAEEAVAEAVAELSSAPPITITLHPVDHLRLDDAGLTERLSETYDDVHWASDPDLEEGDWKVTSPVGALQRLRRDVLATLRDRLGLSAEAPAS